MADINIKVICVGAATQDVFLTGKALTAKRDVRTHNYVELFPLGAKIELGGVFFDTGGGATNAAVTFARQGLRAEFAGKIGHDPAGSEIIRVLKKEGVVTDHVAYDTKQASGYSVLLLAPNGERTVLVYRGASHNLEGRDFDIKTLDGDWFYVTSLAGNFKLLHQIIKHARGSGAKIAWNPGSDEIAKPKKILAMLPDIEVLIGNTTEIKQIFGGEAPKDIMSRAFGHCPYIVMTDGANGTYATDSSKIYYAGQYQKVKVIDRSGAGDAFGSGFVSAIAQNLSIEDAITLGSANSTSVVQKIGAKTGILKTTRLKRMKVRTLSL